MSQVESKPMSKREREKAIFEAFLRKKPEFADEPLKKWKLPEDENEFPDVKCITTNGREIGVELGEWLNKEQMSDAKAMERIQESILSTVGKQPDNTTQNIYFLLLYPKTKLRVKPADVDLLREELFRYINEVDGRWLSELHNPSAYRATSEKLSSFPILQKYVDSIFFASRKNYAGWPPNGRGQDWIRFPNRSGSYSPDIMLQSLFGLIDQKTHRYGAIGTGLDSLYLIHYYSSAAIYNTPVETANFEFKDAAEMARQFLVDDHDPFDHIFLFVRDLVLTVV